MIKEGVCKCGTVIRANGYDKFDDAVTLHFRQSHKGDLDNLNIIADNANKEFDELKEKYPELIFASSFFRIDCTKLAKA